MCEFVAGGDVLEVGRAEGALELQAEAALKVEERVELEKMALCFCSSMILSRRYSPARPGSFSRSLMYWCSVSRSSLSNAQPRVHVLGADALGPRWPQRAARRRGGRRPSCQRGALDHLELVEDGVHDVDGLGQDVGVLLVDSWAARATSSGEIKKISRTASMNFVKLSLAARR